MLNTVFCLLANLPASELLVPTFRNLLAVSYSQALSVEVRSTPVKMDAVLCLLGNLPASELLVPTFRNLLPVPYS